MEVILFFVLVYAAKRGWDDAKSGAAKSRAAYMKRADAKHPDMPKSRRTAHALRHDFGYALSQVAQGFPQVRHGFGAGWHEGRQAHAQARAEYERAKTDHLETRAGLIPDLTDYRRRQKEALERIRSGQACTDGSDAEEEADQEDHAEAREPSWSWGPDGFRWEGARRLDGKPETDADDEEPSAGDVRYSYGSIHRPLAWPTDDLDVARRQAAAMSQDGTPQQVHEYHDGGPGELLDTYVNGEPVSPEEGRELDVQYAGERDAARRECAGQGWPGAAALLDPLPGEDDRNQSASPTEGNTMPTGTASDVTYDAVLAKMNDAVQVAEQHAADVTAAKNEADQIADQMQALDVDPATLSAMADHADALDEAETAHQKVLETAQNVQHVLEAEQGQLAEAHKNTAHAAEKAFFEE